MSFTIDLHTHTSYGSRCSFLPPAKLVETAKAKSLDGICVTEHDWVWDTESLEKLKDGSGLVILRGMEVNTEVGHILVFGVPAYVPGLNSAEQLRREVDHYGGFMIWAHPFRDAAYNLMRRAYLEDFSKASCSPALTYVDGLEVFNGAASGQENNMARELSIKLGFKATGGSDAHAVRELGMCATRFEKNISSEEELIAELKAGRYEAVDLRQERLNAEGGKS
ncbi:MAG: CehA/McbA family metallohydrolase [Bacillota bacterium]